MTAETVKQGATDATQANIYAISYLQLCQISYFDPSLIDGAVSGQMPPPGENQTDPTIGSWRTVWGPAMDSDDSNLAYVAAYYDTTSPAPPLCVVCLRGTDVHIQDTWGILVQVYEDLGVTDPQPLPWDPDGPAQVAEGTLKGLATIQSLLSSGQTLLDFLTGFLGDPANQQPVLVVTGHSLGGALTTVVAQWLKVALGQARVSAPIVPATFAGPTAGNQAFADLYGSTFGYSLRYWNQLDIVPRAWWDLSGIKTIYSDYGQNPPLDVTAGIDLYEVTLSGLGISYAQPPESNAFPGAFDISATDWSDQALVQHATTSYMEPLGGKSILPPSGPIPPILAYKPGGGV